jgi:2-octaprenyl-6-methoxyphenol hydroxylase
VKRLGGVEERDARASPGSRPPPADCDLLIAGGGPIGTAVALGLRGTGLDVALIEPETRPRPEFRPIALAHGSRQILERLGLFGQLAATPIETIHVSQAGGFGRTLIRREDHGVPALGYVCDAGTLAAVLAAAASPERVVGRVVGWQAESDRLRVAVDTENGRCEVAARLLVLADGGQIGGDDLALRDYGQTAIVARVRTEIVRRGTAWERFTDDGPLALLPDGDEASALVWTVRGADAPRLLEASGERFLALLGARFGHRLGRFVAAGPRASFPLRLVFRRSSVAGARTVAVGNAAQTLHPVAGQGLNLGLRDAIELAALARRTAPAALGGDAFLAEYRARRRVDRFAAIGATNFLAGIFADGAPPLRAARGLGLLALDLLPPARRLFARRMMLGLRGAP